MNTPHKPLKEKLKVKKAAKKKTEKMSLSELNSVFRVAWLAERCGAQTFNDLKRLTGVGRRSPLPKFEGDLLDIVCGIIKPQTDSLSKCGVCGRKPTKNANNDSL
jgi:hypothetical protein